MAARGLCGALQVSNSWHHRQQQQQWWQWWPAAWHAEVAAAAAAAVVASSQATAAMAAAGFPQPRRSSDICASKHMIMHPAMQSRAPGTPLVPANWVGELSTMQCTRERAVPCAWCCLLCAAGATLPVCCALCRMQPYTLVRKQSCSMLVQQLQINFVSSSSSISCSHLFAAE
jgi:hypothetical protein